MFSGTDSQSVLNFASNPTTFISRSRPLDADAVQIRAGISCVNENGWEMNVQYLGDFASNQNVHGGMGVERVPPVRLGRVKITFTSRSRRPRVGSLDPVYIPGEVDLCGQSLRHDASRLCGGC